MEKKVFKIVLLIFALALLTRLAYISVFKQLAIDGEAGRFDSMAFAMAKGESLEPLAKTGFEISEPPLHLLFLAVIYKIFGHNLFVVRFIQAILWAICAVLVYFLALKIGMNYKLAWHAGLILALLPSTIIYSGLLYNETFFTFFYLLSFIAFFIALRTDKYKFYALTGILFGLTALISARAQFIEILPVIYIFIIKKSLKRACIYSSVIILCFVLAILPWTVRNYIRTGKFIFLSTYQHYNGIWLCFNRYGTTELDYSKEPLKTLANLPPQERYQKLNEMGWYDLRHYPQLYLRNSVIRFFKLWFSGHSNQVTGLGQTLESALKDADKKILLAKVALLSVNSIFVLLGFLGMIVQLKNIKALAVIYIPVLYLSGLHSLFVSGARLQIPMTVFMAIFAAGGLDFIKSKLTLSQFKPFNFGEVKQG